MYDFVSESFVFIHHLDSFEEYRCEGDIRIDGETEVFVTYSGGKIDSLCYVMGIMGRDAQNLKRYRLCLQTLVYSDPDCVACLSERSKRDVAFSPDKRNHDSKRVHIRYL